MGVPHMLHLHMQFHRMTIRSRHPFGPDKHNLAIWQADSGKEGHTAVWCEADHCSNTHNGRLLMLVARGAILTGIVMPTVTFLQVSRRCIERKAHLELLQTVYAAEGLLHGPCQACFS